MLHVCTVYCFFFNDTATTEIYTLSLHDALPICIALNTPHNGRVRQSPRAKVYCDADRKSTRLNSSHLRISYAVFCLKKNVQFSGGEPTMHPRFFDAIRRARKIGYNSWQAATNVIEFAKSKDYCMFFFKEAGPPEYFPFSPTGPSPN